MSVTMRRARTSAEPSSGPMARSVLGEAAGDAGAREGGGQEADERDAELDGGQQPAGLLGHARDPPGPAVALVAELADAAAADRHERDLGGHEDAVERDEDGDDDDLEERAAHQRPAASSEPAAVGCAPRPAGGAHGCGPASRGPACRRARPS